METTIFADRRGAGRQLGKALTQRGYKGENSLVLGIYCRCQAIVRRLAESVVFRLDHCLENR